MTVPIWAWFAFGVLVVGLLAVDLLVHRHHHGLSHKSAIGWTMAWIAAGLAFNGFVWVTFGARAASEYFSAYLLEKSLSVDNLFVFMVIFSHLRVPASEERQVLTWGIWGAILMRGLFIALGITLLENVSWLTFVFGGILIASSFKLARAGGTVETKSAKRLSSFLMRRLPYVDDSSGGRFFVRKNGRLVATPLFVALVAIEFTDVVFAIDSVPAALAVTTRPFIVYSSNVFAILGLRSLYIAVSGFLRKLEYLRYGLAAILLFAGVKMVASRWVHLHPAVSLAVITGCLAIAVVASLLPRASRHRASSS